MTAPTTPMQQPRYVQVHVQQQRSRVPTFGLTAPTTTSTTTLRNSNGEDHHTENNDDHRPAIIKILADSMASAVIENHDRSTAAAAQTTTSVVVDGNVDNVNAPNSHHPTTTTTTPSSSSSVFFNAADRQSLKADCAVAIDKAIQDGLIDLSKLRDKYQRDMLNDGSMDRLQQTMALNGIREAAKFDAKVDTIIGGFLNATATSRGVTHQLALEDLMRIRKEEKEKEEATLKKKNKKGMNNHHHGGGGGGGQGTTTTAQTWKKTNDAWDAWDDDW